MTVTAVLFDIDGTLVDSNFLHVDAWQRALAELGSPTDAWRIHRAIGQDSDRLLRSVAGDHDEQWMSDASALHSRYYRELAPRLRAFDRVPELLRAVASRGIAVVLATSAPEDELAMLLDVIDAPDAIHATTSADDVETAKPDPGILKVALERARATPSDAIMVGDSVWDLTAAARAHLRSVGVLSGGVGAGELAEAGAFAVYDDPAGLLRNLDAIL